MQNYYVSLVLSILLGSTAQFLLKKAVIAEGVYSLLDKLKILIISPFLWMGLICYGLSLLFWLNVLSKMELSKAYPLVSVGYIITLFLGYFFFDESITTFKVAGVFLIITGVFCIAK